MDQASARTFIYTHGRLLERRLYEFHFDGGSPADVVRALEAYRNADGGYGQALEPDCRTPHSQPEALRWALQVAAEVNVLDAVVAQRAWRERIGARLAAGDVVAVDPQAEVARPDAHTPLDFAPTPDHPLAALFGAATLRGFVDRQSARQADDGGLPIGWPAPGSTALSEWRAIVTLEALQREAAYGGG